MSKAVAKQPSTNLSAQTLSQVILHGNLKDLTPVQKVEYYGSVCSCLGLNPATKPFDYIVLNGKEVLYANKGCAEQLRELHKISLKVVQTQVVNDVYVVTIEASNSNGRVDSATGAVSIKGLTGEFLANAFMKCETKAKRRATLSICGLNMLDETEVHSIPGAMEPSAAPSAPHGPSMSSAAPAIQPKQPADAPTRASVGKEIMALQKTMGMPDTELAEWASNKFGKETLKALTISEMIELRDELQNELKGK